MAGTGKKIIVTVSNDIVTDQRMERICTSLVDMGYEVEIVGRKMPGSFPFVAKHYKQSRLRLIFNKGPLFYLELNFRLLLYLSAFQPSIIYSADADTALAGVWAKKILKAKLIFDAHELFSEVPELHNRPLIKRIWQRIEKLIIDEADTRLTVSKSIANYYSGLYGKPFEVIRNISKIKSPLIVSPSNTRYILYQGALNKGRGLEQLIEASNNMDIEIKIAGDGDIALKLKHMAKGNDKIIFLGKLRMDDLDEITANAWLGYNLLEEQSLSYTYSLSNKTFDYMHAGIPQLLPNMPEYIDLNNEWDFGLITNLNATDIIASVKLLKENNSLYDSLCENAQAAARVLTWENESLKLTNIFKSLTQ